MNKGDKKMKRFKRPFYSVIALTVAVGLAACTSDEPDENTGGSPDGGEATGEGGDLVIAMQSEISGFDPHQVNDVPSGQVQNQVFEGLVAFDEDMNIEERLAESYEAVDNTLTFKLREGIQFHDGEAFNAEAVKTNIERITDEDIASQRAFLFEEITEINVLDEYEIEFVTEEPFAPLIFSFAHSGGNMISPAVIEEDYAAMEDGEQPFTAVNANPAGTGYFKYESGGIGTEIVLSKNEDYWGETALLDTVTFKVVPDGNTRVAEVSTGDSHVIEPLDVSAIPQLESTDGASMLETQSISASYFGFNTEKEPFDNPDVRRAIAMAIDNEVILDNIWEGHGIVANGPIAPGVVGYDESISPIEFDPEGARELLEEAGAEDLSISLMTNDSEARLDIATYIESALSDVGINVTINSSDFPTYLEATANGEHEMYILGWSSATGDADYALAPLFHTDNHGTAGNRSFYSNPELDQLLEDAAQEIDEDTRAEMYKEAQEIIVNDAPVVFSYYQEYLNGVRDEVKGFKRSMTGDILLQETYIEQ